MFYLEISAKTGHNVEEAFYKMAFEVNEQSKRSSSTWSRESKDRDRSRGSDHSAGSEGQRIKLTRSREEKTGKYAAANEVPTGLEGQKKKKCCN